MIMIMTIMAPPPRRGHWRGDKGGFVFKRMALSIVSLSSFPTTLTAEHRPPAPHVAPPTAPTARPTTRKGTLVWRAHRCLAFLTFASSKRASLNVPYLQPRRTQPNGREAAKRAGSFGHVAAHPGWCAHGATTATDGFTTRSTRLHTTHTQDCRDGLSLLACMNTTRLSGARAAPRVWCAHVPCPTRTGGTDEVPRRGIGLHACMNRQGAPCMAAAHCKARYRFIHV